MQRPSVPDDDLNGFRALLAVGAVVSVGLGVWGLLGGGIIRTALGPVLPREAPGFVAMARLYGAAMLALGIGYGLAAVHPVRNRGLLVPLFAAPLAGAVALIVAAAKDELSPVRAGVLAAFEIAYCLLYFRLYPKPVAAAPERSEDEGPTASDEPSSSDDDDQPPSIA